MTTSCACCARTDAVTTLLRSGDGANLLTAYRRAANILRIEERKDGARHDWRSGRSTAQRNRGGSIIP